MEEIDTSKCKDNFSKVSYINTFNGDCQMKHFFEFCKDVKIEDCYYKQLKLKEKECEELKTKLEKINMIFFAKYVNGIDMNLKDRILRVLQIIEGVNKNGRRN